MDQKPARTDWIFGSDNDLESLADHYQCGHCPSETRRLSEDHIVTLHEPQCPAITGAVSTVPDIFRAATRTR